MGGLTVLAALRAELEHEDFVYLGDTARLPYGTKSPETVQRYAVQAAAALVDCGVKALVVACNTASGLALETLAKEFAPIPVYGVVLPGAEAAAKVADSSGVLVLATESTVMGGAYQRALAELEPTLPVTANACPLWVTLAETGEQSSELVDAILRHSVAVDHPATVLLGCTHFPVFHQALSARFPQTQFVDSAATTATAVARDLNSLALLQKEGSGTLRFLATDGVERFRRVGSYFLGEEIAEVELIDL